jgi:UDP-N-acetylmuramoyl-tripeptide--D-alanyl-D-alanine ligase
VGDTLHALGEIGRAHRVRWGGRAAAITGSAGKTTTKELTHAALSAAGVRVERTAGNLNNLIGLPMTLLALDAQTEIAVLEIGTSGPGEIARLAEIAQPEVGVVTEVAVAHAEGLGTLEGVAREKASLLWALPSAGVAIYNGDNAALCAQLDAVKATRVSFGSGEQVDVRLLQHEVTARPSSRCRFQVPGLAAPLVCELSLFGHGPAVDAAAALAVVRALLGDAALEAAAGGLSAVAAVPGRLHPIAGPRGSLILDDSYNANPASMRASIDTACALARARGGRVLLVLADMRELGDATRAEHEAVGRLAAAREVAALIACGAEMARAAAVARTLRSDLSVTELGDAGGAADALRAVIAEADVVLVKGSRSMATERVVADLQEVAA